MCLAAAVSPMHDLQLRRCGEWETSLKDLKKTVHPARKAQPLVCNASSWHVTTLRINTHLAAPLPSTSSACAQAIGGKILSLTKFTANSCMIFLFTRTTGIDVVFCVLPICQALSCSTTHPHKRTVRDRCFLFAPGSAPDHGLMCRSIVHLHVCK